MKIKKTIPSKTSVPVSQKTADLVARWAFSLFDEPKDKCQRLQAHGGSHLGRETNLGGACEEAFARIVYEALKSVAKHKP